MSGLALAVVMWAQVAAAEPPAPAAESASVAASYGPTLPPPPKPAKAPAPAQPCATELPTEPGEVVVCAVRPQGYRIDPDVLAAKKMKREGTSKPARPDRMVDASCKVVGPMGCRHSGGIDLLAAAATVAKMADMVSKGENVGSMFVTDPQSSEYELYQQAKRDREAKQEEAEIKAAVEAAKNP